MVKIVCKLSKGGKEYLALEVNGVLLFVEHDELMRIARTVGLSARDVYSLRADEYIIIEEV